MGSCAMYFPASPFDSDDAKLCAELVSSAYDMFSQWEKEKSPRKSDFKWTPATVSLTLQYGAPIWSDEVLLWGLIKLDVSPFAFIATNNGGDAFLVFRGTQVYKGAVFPLSLIQGDIFADADGFHTKYELTTGYGSVDQGFYDLYKSMRDEIASQLNALKGVKRLFITGHSLGCGLSTLCVPDIICNTDYKPSAMPVLHYNFASPRVGAPDFVTAYNANGVPTFRVVNTCDLVPNVPPACLKILLYEHVGIPICYTAQYQSVGGNHSLVSSYLYALNNPEDPQGPLV